MLALVTGASSGIGYEISKYLSKLGYDIIAVARNLELLEKLKECCTTNVLILEMDLSVLDNCQKLYMKTKEKNIDILVNCAGFGVFGSYIETDLNKEINMLNLNILALHTLMKLYLQDMYIRNTGYILNVASIAGFMPGPLMSAYYASKAYVLRLTQAIAVELKQENSNVHVSVLCPGPVKTNFNKVAGVNFGINSLTSEFVAKYAIDKMLKNKLVIIPGKVTKILRILSKIFPDKIVSNVSYHIQTKKIE